MASSAPFDMSRAYNDKTFSDVSIKFGETEIYCHKLVLCQASDYFKACCGPDSSFAESNQRTIELFEDDTDAVELMLQYMYNISYDKIIEEMKNNGKSTGLKLQMGICMVGKKYLILDLQEKGLAGIRTHVSEIEATKDAATTFSAYCFLSEHRDHDPAFATMVVELGKTHLPHLFEFEGFRKMLEQDENREVLEVAIQGVKRVYEPPKTVTVTKTVTVNVPVAVPTARVRKRMECYQCGNEWYTSC